MRSNKFGVFLSVAAVALTMVACNKDEDSKSGGTVSTDFKATRISEAALRDASFALTKASGIPLRNTADVRGRSRGAELESLSYLVSSIEFCGKLVTNGTGTNCQSGAWQLYSNQSQDYDNFLPANAATTTDGFVNFMDKDALKAFGQSSTYSDGNVQTYDGATIYWYRPFKVKASMTLTDGTKIYTKATTDFPSNGKTGLDVTFESRTDSMTTGPAEEAVFFLPNGGTYFRLQKPLEITQADVDNKTNFKVVFAFDPDDIITGTKLDLTGWIPDPNWRSGHVDATNGYRIDAPFLNAAPVVAREGETIMREVYLLRSADQIHDVRVSLYYIKEDATKAVQAVTLTNILYGIPSHPIDFAQPTQVETDAEGKLNFKDWMGNNIIAGLQRSTTPGVLGNVSHVQCAAGSISSGGCSNGVETSTYSYAFVGEGSVEADVTAGYTPPPVEDTAP